MWNRNFRRNSRQQVVPLSRASCVSPVELIDRRGRRGWARSQIIRTQESLILYKSFNTLWFLASCHSWNTKASLPCLQEKICNKYTDFLVKKVRYGSGTTIPNPDPTQPISSGSSYRIRIHNTRKATRLGLGMQLLSLLIYPFPCPSDPDPVLISIELSICFTLSLATACLNVNAAIGSIISISAMANLAIT